MCFRVFTRPLVSSHYMSVIPLPPTGTTKNVPDTSRCPLGGGGKLCWLRTTGLERFSYCSNIIKPVPLRISKPKWVSLMKNNRESEK